MWALLPTPVQDWTTIPDPLLPTKHLTPLKDSTKAREQRIVVWGPNILYTFVSSTVKKKCPTTILDHKLFGTTYQYLKEHRLRTPSAPKLNQLPLPCAANEPSPQNPPLSKEHLLHSTWELSSLLTPPKELRTLKVESISFINPVSDTQSKGEATGYIYCHLQEETLSDSSH